jgi:flagellar biosynthesis/type III secretory pathway protein FliH
MAGRTTRHPPHASHLVESDIDEKTQYGILLNEVNDLDEVRVMLSDKLEEWAKEYIAEGRQEGRQGGRQEGRQEGEILALQKLLAKRFGAIPFDITAQIANASLDQIEHWFDKAIDADTLSDVFK